MSQNQKENQKKRKEIYDARSAKDIQTRRDGTGEVSWNAW